MKVSAKQYARSLFELTSKLSSEKTELVIRRFVSLLQDRHDLAQSDKIINELSLLLEQDKGELSAELSSAYELSVDSKKTIATYLENKLGANKINWTEKVDKSLLGGFVLRYQGFVLDGSLKNNLRKFKKQLLIK